MQGENLPLTSTKVKPSPNEKDEQPRAN